MTLEFQFEPAPALHKKPLHRHAASAELEQIRHAIAKSQRPCIYAGGGIISGGASEELTRFAETYNIPVATSLMGIGAFPETHPLSLKYLGMHGTYYANYAADQCDLLLAFGARFADRSTGNAKEFARDAFIIHIDIDESEINKNVHADIGTGSLFFCRGRNGWRRSGAGRRNIRWHIIRYRTS